MITVVLLFLLDADPTPSFQMIREFNTIGECRAVIRDADLKPEIKARLICQRFINDEDDSTPPDPKKHPTDGNA